MSSKNSNARFGDLRTTGQLPQDAGVSDHQRPQEQSLGFSVTAALSRFCMCSPRHRCPHLSRAVELRCGLARSGFQPGPVCGTGQGRRSERRMRRRRAGRADAHFLFRPCRLARIIRSGQNDFGPTTRRERGRYETLQRMPARDLRTSSVLSQLRGAIPRESQMGRLGF